MKISIVTPSYNQGMFIEKTIKSVLDQEYSELEYIVIDGGSTDNTLEILKKYSKKIKWISEKDKGQSNAINKGMRMVTGDIITFLNSDDILLPNALSKVASFFKINPRAKWICGNYYIINSKGRNIRPYIRWYKNLLRIFSSRLLLLITNYVIQPSSFWKKEVLDKIGYFDEKLHYEMDYDYWLRISKYYSLFIINDSLSLFRLHNFSKSGIYYHNQFKEEIDVLKKHKINSLLIYIHKIHNKIIIFIYNLITLIDRVD